jgi:hypothetical protein
MANGDVSTFDVAIFSRQWRTGFLIFVTDPRIARLCTTRLEGRDCPVVGGSFARYSRHGDEVRVGSLGRTAGVLKARRHYLVGVMVRIPAIQCGGG